jgi:hypothetical protein
MKNIILLILIMLNLNATFDKNSNPHQDLSITMQKVKDFKK